MEYVVVTLTFPYLKAKYPREIEKHAKDLLFPLDTPQHILIETLIDALDIDIDKNKLRGFLSTYQKGRMIVFRPEKTLRDVGIKYGDFLILDFQEILAKASLVCMDGPEFDLERDDAIIGCHPDADIDLRSVPNQEYVSRRHAKILCRGGKYYIIALDSLNGTYVGENEVVSGKEILLKKGDIIRFGASDERAVKMYIRKRTK